MPAGLPRGGPALDPVGVARRLVPERAARRARRDRRQLAERHRLRRDDVVHAALVSVLGQRARDDPRELGPPREAHPRVADGFTRNAVVVEPARHVVGVHRVADRGERDAGVREHRLRRAVRPRVEEDRIRSAFAKER